MYALRVMFSVLTTRAYVSWCTWKKGRSSVLSSPIDPRYCT
jgi:hypothetical protein